MNHLGTVDLETDRLILRRFTFDDAEYMYDNWAKSDSVTKYLTWESHKSIEDSKEVLASWIANYENKDYYQWTIVLKESDEPIGSIGVVEINKLVDSMHIGYCIGEYWWGKGITKEALEIIIKFLFEDVKVNRIDARHDPNNPGSGKVMLKCGLKYEGRLRESDKNNQGLCDASYYAILASDYFSQ